MKNSQAIGDGVTGCKRTKDLIANDKLTIEMENRVLRNQELLKLQNQLSKQEKLAARWSGVFKYST